MCLSMFLTLVSVCLGKFTNKNTLLIDSTVNLNK